MCERRRWFPDIFSNFQRNNDSHITWSSASEEDTDGSVTRKKRKSVRNKRRYKPEWVHVECEIKHEIDCSASPMQSPPLTRLDLEQEESPFLYKPSTNYRQNQSPLIVDTCNVNQTSNCFENEDSDDIFKSNGIDSQSPIKTQIKISPPPSQQSQPYAIDPFPSQHSSPIPSQPNNKRSNLIYQQPPTRRKHYRQGDLAYRLQKAINSFNASIAIWQHEIFLSKLNEETVTSQVSEGIIINFFVAKKWTEFGCTIYECTCSGSGKLFNTLGCSDVETEAFLIVANSEIINLLNVKASYKLFPSYAARIVIYMNCKTVCLINISRVLTLE